jgi:hypothetical protein
VREGKSHASLEAKLLLPLKCLAYGVPPHTFQDYFSMSVTFAKECVRQFNRGVKEIYEKEYLRLPTADDLKEINNLHKQVHGVDGMLGSIDCMHVRWKNCPVAWQGSFKGKEKKPTLVLEAICDYQLWFWHASFGYAGSLNDLNIIQLSPFQRALVDGTFIAKEEESQVVPYSIGDDMFNQMFVLADGIYRQLHLSRLVSAISNPATKPQKKFTAWQESARKDIERAFGVLQCKFQYMARPLLQLDLDLIGVMVATCLILHNMCVADRIMGGDPRATYRPTNSLEEPEDPDAMTYDERQEKWSAAQAKDATGIHVTQTPNMNPILSGMAQRYKALHDKDEHIRIHKALMVHFSS